MDYENVDETKVEPAEMMDMQIEANDIIIKMLENRIKALEEELKEKENEIENLKKKESLEALPETFQIPKHLSSVQKRHLKSLNGYKMIYKTKPNGAFAQNATAVHIHENEEEALGMKRMINNHIADNFDSHYKNFIALPYVEVVGVGKNARIVTKNTREELLEFLRSEESLYVYSNYHELCATANLYNIKISIFTYGGSEDHWKYITPDPNMVSKDDEKIGKHIPDMALYHNEDTHFDLLVKDDSRLAQLGLLAGAKTTIQMDEEEDNEDWQEVRTKRTNKNEIKGAEAEVDKEKLLLEGVSENEHEDDLVDEITLLGMKNGGHRRESPTEGSVENVNMFECKKCTSKFFSKSLFEVHQKNHDLKLACENCADTFKDEDELTEHLRTKHSQEEWNCMDCAFQASCASELMKHLRLKAHQPSINVTDKRKLFSDYRQCYTCKMDFDGYKNLMDHRRSLHPSKVKCRDYPNNCPHGIKCWFVHSEKDVNNEMLSDQFKCEPCDKIISGRNNFMIHRKTKHAATVPVCNLFKLNECKRSDEVCWFLHNNKEHKSMTYAEALRTNTQKNPRTIPEKDQVFQEVIGDTPPPENMQSVLEMMKRMYVRMENMDMKIQSLMK